MLTILCKSKTRRGSSRVKFFIVDREISASEVNQECKKAMELIDF
jgi:hypothetical protein